MLVSQVDNIPVLILIGALLVCAPVIYAKVREDRHDERKFRCGVDSAEATIGAFKKRRRRSFLYLAFGVAASATVVLPSGPSPLIALLFLSGGIAAFYATYCCPMCYSMVVGDSLDDGVDLTPAVCLKCGAPLSKG